LCKACIKTYEDQEYIELGLSSGIERVYISNIKSEDINGSQNGTIYPGINDNEWIDNPINYEDYTIDTILPERHVFMGNTYFYGKIVSMFGDNFMGKKNSAANIMQYMMMSEMMKGMNGGGASSGNNMMSNMLPFMMMGGKMGGMFDNMFNFFDSDSDNDEDNEDDESLFEEMKKDLKKKKKSDRKVVEDDDDDEDNE
jgi:hypothetical protein